MKRTGATYHERVRGRTAWIVAAVVGVVAVGGLVAALALGGRDDRDRAADPAPTRGDCAELAADQARRCYVAAFSAELVNEADPRAAVERITALAWDTGGFLLPNCHGIMHTVGREYAREQGVTLGTLMDYLPRTNDPGCPAGFAHGLVTAVAPAIDPADPAGAASVCVEAATRYQRYSCTHGFGHAFMRIHGEDLEPALAMCRALGTEAAPDCAQGAFHDYWFAVRGLDGARLEGEAVTEPRRLCAAQGAEFVRPCWYRAFVDVRPTGFEVASPADFEALCGGLQGLQRDACVTAASVIGPADPEIQIGICAELQPLDQPACVRGTKVQNLLGATVPDYVQLARTCDLLAARGATACYRWLGKTISVVTDGAFVRRGCPRLPTRLARRACAAGAASADEALVTFS